VEPSKKYRLAALCRRRKQRALRNTRRGVEKTVAVAMREAFLIPEGSCAFVSGEQLESLHRSSRAILGDSIYSGNVSQCDDDATLKRRASSGIAFC
jgi:hypothetical protein